jgi:hypothetical protein
MSRPTAEGFSMASFDLYGEYLDSSLNGLFGDNLLFNDNRSRFAITEHGLVGAVEIGIAPSWWNEDVEAEYSYFFSPNTFFWLPSKAQLATWQQTCPRLDRKKAFRENSKNCHLIVRAHSTEPWLYVGKARFYTAGSVNGVEWKYGFRISPRLPRDVWMKFGGYTRWLVIIGREQLQVSKPSDILSILKNEWGQTSTELNITRYEGDSMVAFANESGMSVVGYDDSKHEFTSYDPDRENSSETVVFRRAGQPGHEVSVSRVIPKDAAIQIITEFLQSGRATGLRPL